jgi:hypothetical protein
MLKVTAKKNVFEGLKIQDNLKGKGRLKIKLY